MDAAPATHRPRRDRTGTSFADERGIERRLKVSWHPERRIFVLSLWHGDTCTGTFRLPLGEVPRLVGTLVDVLGQAASSPDPDRERPRPGTPQLVDRARAWGRTLPDRWRRRS